MAGVTFTPDLYKCGIAGAGISDLQLFVGDLKKESQYEHLSGKTWIDVVGDPIADRERLIATSPARHVARIKAPLLLVHGKDDSVVPFKQSELMAGAMRSAGKRVELVMLEGGDHSLNDAQTSRRVLRELERFLGLHLK
jgi:dipeptidyl aminopeptidase/acylaminoacyl peptidase